jgi:acetylornithine deacetylase/succinyl-diaminopimelate desuccinylase-like protein
LIEGFYDGVQAPTKEELQNLENIPFNEEAYMADFGIKKFIKTGLELKKDYYYKPSLTIDGIGSGYQGEGAKTVLPELAKAKIDFRLVPNQKPDDIVNKLKRHLSKDKFKHVQITSAHGYPPARTPLTSPYVKIVRETAEMIYGTPLIVHPTTAGSGPMYLFVNKMDCLSLGCGHIGGSPHSPNENIIIEDLILNMKHLTAIFHQLR